MIDPFLATVPEMLTPARTLGILMLQSPPIFAYVGPDQILPFASVLSAIAGIALMFWNRLLSFFGLCRSLIFGRSRTPPAPAPPAAEGEPAD